MWRNDIIITSLSYISIFYTGGQLIKYLYQSYLTYFNVKNRKVCSNSNFENTKHEISDELQRDEVVNYQTILDYWIGGDINVNYKTKWFPSQSTGQQKTTDEEIFDRFKEVLHMAERGEFDHWKDSPQSLLALIIVLDQFSRHIYRHEDRSLIEKNDIESLKLAKWMVEKGWLSSLSAPEFVFSIMPYRHTPTLENLEMVKELIEEFEERRKGEGELLTKFSKV